MQKDRKLTFGALIEELAAVWHENGEITDEDWAVYFRDTDKLKKNTVCYLADPIDVTDDDEEIYPEYALQNKTDSYLTCELLIDVVTEYLSEKSNATVKQLIDAVNYYVEYDCFMDPDGRAADPYSIPQVVIEKTITDKKVLMQIRKAFAIQMPFGEFLKASQELPFVITEKYTLAEAKKIIKNNNLKEYVTVKY